LFARPKTDDGKALTEWSTSEFANMDGDGEGGLSVQHGQRPRVAKMPSGKRGTLADIFAIWRAVRLNRHSERLINAFACRYGIARLWPLNPIGSASPGAIEILGSRLRGNDG
jgi:hypothetical protein